MKCVFVCLKGLKFNVQLYIYIISKCVFVHQFDYILFTLDTVPTVRTTISNRITGYL